MIVDFIKSWLYYPKLKEYLEHNGQREFDWWGTRWKYAKWHCGRVLDCIKWHFCRKKIKKAMQDSDWARRYEDKIECKELEDLIREIDCYSDGWASVYDREPITK